MQNKTIRMQIIWGVVLVLAGIGVFVRIPQVAARIETFQFFSYFCFYLLGLLLIGGGAKKLYKYFPRAAGKNPHK